MVEFTFQSWLEGKIDPRIDSKINASLAEKIVNAKIKALEKLIHLKMDENIFDALSQLEEIKEEKDKRILFEEIISSYNQTIINSLQGKIMARGNLWYLKPPTHKDLNFIDGPLFQKIMDSNNYNEINLNEDFLAQSYFLAKVRHLTKRKLEEYKQVNNQNLNTDLQVEKIKILSHKIALLYELGILELINERFKSSSKNNNTQKAKLLSIILGESNKKSIESIRKLLSYINQKDHRQNPITLDSITSVEKILLEFGLSKEKI